MESLGASEAGASEAGACEAGASEAGACEAGACEAGASEAGACEAAAQDSNTQIIMRQTNYTNEEAVLQLQLYNNDISKVIRAYLSTNNMPSSTQTLSLNQQIYKEFRLLLHEDLSKRAL